MKPTRVAARVVCVVTGLALLLTVGVWPADAKKKKGGGDPAAEAKLKETVDGLGPTLSKLLSKIQSRYLFSPEDSGQLADARFKLMDLMQQFPKNPLLIQPVYQAAVVSKKREDYDEAFEMFSFLSANFPDNQYGLRAQGEIQSMRRLLGENYFPKTSIFEAPGAASATPPGKTPPPKKK
ncbi:MAG: hypothetical protein IPK79_10465 [Vampirovibrionales bacterium]|nr:hypothetical protein [Vampirovibrionales bacterium]